jgi:prefoldin alpha subunit
MKMSTASDPLTNVIMQVQYFENVAQSLQQRFNYVEATIAELQVALNTISEISKESGGADILVPVGAGSYLRAKAADVEKLIVGIGADVAVERTVKEATDAYQIRIDELRKVRESLGQDIERVAMGLSKARQELETLTRKSEGK